jgi:hypothetical protein
MVHAHVLQRELRTAAGVNVSDQTIRSRLHAANLRSRRSVVRIPLSRCHRRLRMEWCRPPPTVPSGVIVLENGVWANLL